ncbi:MAG: flagellar assembly protein FliW [Chthoniobacteraceae bacterium]
MTLSASAQRTETNHAPGSTARANGNGGVPEITRVDMVVALPNGLIGLPEVTQLEVIRNPENWPFITLRSATQDGLQFLAIEPQDFVPDYVIELNDIDTEALGIGRAEDAQVLNIVTVHSSDPQFVTTNLIGPVVINRRTGIARQVIIANSEQYSARYVLADERI